MPCDLEQPVRVEDVPRIDYTTLCRFVGSDTLDGTPIAHNVRAWLCDTGLIDGHPVNQRATIVREAAAVAAGYPHHPSPYALHGDAVLVGPVDDAGDESSVPGWVVELLTLGQPS